MYPRTFPITLASLIIVLAGCAQTPPDLGIERIIITPGSLLFTAQGQSQQLGAVALGADGQPVEVEINWSSSRSEVVSVDAAGNALAQSDLGSSQIIASVGKISSAPVLAVVAQVNEGVVLVSDAQIVNDPTPLTPDAVPEIGVQYHVTLKDVSAPTPGTLLMGTGDKPLAGRVISVTETTEGLETTLELVHPDELFARVRISESLNLDNAETSSVPELQQPDALEGQAEREEEYGPFKCKINSPQNLTDILQFKVPPAAKVEPRLDLLLDWDSDSGYKRFILQGGAKVTFQFSPTVTAVVTYSLECLLELERRKIPIKGVWEIFLGGDVPMGLGFKLEGKGTAGKLGLEFNRELGADFKFGLECLVGRGCDWVKDFTPINKGKFDFVFPDAGTQFRLEGTVFPFLWVGTELGVGFFKKAHLKLLELKAGIEQTSNLAPPAVQASDASYASDYKMSLTGVISAGTDIEKAKKVFGDGLGKLEFKVGSPLGTSPKASTLAADKTTFKQGDKVTFTVTIDPVTYKYPYQFPEVGYNIREVRLYRRAATGDLTLLVSQQPSGEQREFKLEWTSDVDGSLGKDYFAFVMPVFLGLELELGYIGEPVLPTCTAPPPGARYCVLEIGTLGGNSSEAYDLNEKGQVVGYASTKEDTTHAFLWQNGTLTDLTLNASSAGATSLNENGQVVGFWRSAPSSPAQAFSWQNGTFTDLGLFGSSEGISADVCVNNAGQIVTTTLDPPIAILVQNGVVTQLKDPANFRSRAGCINEKGQVAGVGFVSEPSSPLEHHALLWQAGGVTDLGTVALEHNTVVVTDLNDSAAVVGYSAAVNNLPGHAFLWQGGQVSDLGTLGGSNSLALGINNSGQIVGMSQKFNLEMAASLWEGTTIRDLNILIGDGTGWQLDVAYDINDKGYVVGIGRHNGAPRGFLLVPAQP